MKGGKVSTVSQPPVVADKADNVAVFYSIFDYTPLERVGHAQTPQLTNMLARISLRPVSLAARVSTRSYTSSAKEGSVAASREFGYVSLLFAAGFEPTESDDSFLVFVARKRRHMKACVSKECQDS